MKLSVVVPAYREEDRIAECVRAARAIGDEVVVAVAEGPDRTAEIAERAGARVVIAAKGRGAQLAGGATLARGDVLLFLHADVHAPVEARAAIARALADPDVAGGNFHLRFVPDGAAARLFGWANDARRRWLSIYYGDSGIFVRRSWFERLGGFRPIPLFEDYDFVQRLERLRPRARTAYVRDVTLLASARRFEARPLRTLALWTALQLGWSAGVSPEALARWYAR